MGPKTDYNPRSNSVISMELSSHGARSISPAEGGKVVAMTPMEKLRPYLLKQRSMGKASEI